MKTQEEMMQYRNYDTVDDTEKQMLLDMIHEIKKYKAPPDRKGDPYNLRYPWQKLGGVSSGISMVWCWYWDGVILNNTQEIDLLRALTELKAEELKAD